MMASSFNHDTTYFWEEGKPNLRDCLRLSFEAAKRHDIPKIVIFTGAGEGIRIAVEEFLSQDDYAHIQIIAVTFPQGQEFTSKEHDHGISDENCGWMIENKIPLVRAHLPFDPIKSQFQTHGVLGQDFGLLGNVLNIFGGGMSLCVQAVLMACDAGVVKKGDHVISLTSDTSILVRSAPTSHLLTDFIVREVFCKSVLLTVSKREKLAQASATPEITSIKEPKLIEGK
jgi:uncharacterized protein